MITSPLRDRVVCITGPTASGKTALALHLARTLDVDLISVDSSQVYCGMNVGTAKPTQDVLEEFPHALVNVRAIDEPYSAADRPRCARACAPEFAGGTTSGAGRRNDVLPLARCWKACQSYRRQIRVFGTRSATPCGLRA